MDNLTKGEILDILVELILAPQYFCDNGANAGKYKMTLHYPYLDAHLWDRIQQEINERKFLKVRNQ